MNIDDFINNLTCVLIIPHGRSGSYMAASLFDGHNNVLSIPKAFAVDKDIETEQGNVPSCVLNRFVQQNPDLFSDTVSKSFDISSSAQFGRIPIERDDYAKPSSTDFLLVGSNFRFTNVDEKNWIHRAVLVHSAYVNSLNKNSMALGCTHIIIHVHLYGEIDFISDLRGCFKRFHFLAMVRDPLESFLSYYKLGLNFGSGMTSFPFSYALMQLDLATDTFNRLLVELRSNSNGVHLIDLKKFNASKDPNIKIMAEAVGLEVSSSLFVETANGGPWEGNTVNSVHHSEEFINAGDALATKIEPFIRNLRYELGYCEKPNPKFYHLLASYLSLIRMGKKIFPGLGTDLVDVTRLAVHSRKDRLYSDVMYRLGSRGLFTRAQLFGFGLFIPLVMHLKVYLLSAIKPVSPIFYGRLFFKLNKRFSDLRVKSLI